LQQSQRADWTAFSGAEFRCRSPAKIAINKRFMATAGRQAAAGQAASQFVSTLSNDVGYQTYGQRSAKPWTAGARFWHMGAVAALG
jgi:hypothetical protein